MAFSDGIEGSDTPSASIPSTPMTLRGNISSAPRATTVAVRPVGWYRVPERVLAVRLDGSVEYETSDGVVRDVATVQHLRGSLTD